MFAKATSWPGSNSAVEEATVALDKARAASEAAIASRSARVAFLTRRRDRFSQLQSRGAVPDAELDEAAADLAIAKADLAEARDQRRIASLEYERSVASLNQRSVRSPIDGVVVERKLAAGEYAYDQAPILTLAEVDPLNVEVYLPIAFFPKNSRRIDRHRPSVRPRRRRISRRRGDRRHCL